MLDISVVISTYNREAVLRQTLERMCLLDRSGLEVEFVLIDNNSTDDTGAVIEAFAERLPIRHMFEPRKGKPAALNRVLDTVELGHLVVFTDDDIIPDLDWLQQIADVSWRRPDINVFGGRIVYEVPADAPSWAHQKGFGFAFVAHGIGAVETTYPWNGQALTCDCPCGGNFWVRKCVITPEHRFAENLRSGLMGSDRRFILRFLEEGHDALFCPGASVQHRIKSELLTRRGIIRRAVNQGRSAIHVYGQPHRDVLESHPRAWRSLRRVSVARATAGGLAGLLAGLLSDRAFARSMKSMWSLGYHLEALKRAPRDGAVNPSGVVPTCEP